MALKGRFDQFDRRWADARFRRILPIPARSGGSRLTGRIPAVQPRRPEGVKVPLLRSFAIGRLLDQSQTPQRYLEAFRLQRTRFEMIVERKLRRGSLSMMAT
jgi:hypothetical protein